VILARARSVSWSDTASSGPSAHPETSKCSKADQGKRTGVESGVVASQDRDGRGGARARGGDAVRVSSEDGEGGLRSKRVGCEALALVVVVVVVDAQPAHVWAEVLDCGVGAETKVLLRFGGRLDFEEGRAAGERRVGRPAAQG
jgi:hypothetical protein